MTIDVYFVDDGSVLFQYSTMKNHAGLCTILGLWVFLAHVRHFNSGLFLETMSVRYLKHGTMIF